MDLAVAFIGAFAAITSAIIGLFAVRGVQRNRHYAESLGEQLDTGNGIALGSTVHRIDTTLAFVATAVEAQSQTLRAQGALLENGAQHFEELDQRITEVCVRLDTTEGKTE